MSRSAALGERKEVDLPAGRVRYRELGSGRPVVFVHGLLVNGDLWRKVAPSVAAAGFRAVVPDWPLGSHEVPMRPDADLSPPGLAALIAGFIEALDLDDVVLVGNDTGGALSQLVITQHPKRIGGVVLTNCDCFERFFPPLFRYLQTLPHIPGGVWLMAQSMRLRAVQRMPNAFGSLTHRPIDPETMASYVVPVRDRGIRRDVAAVLRGIDKRHTLAAADALPGFDRPALLVWGADDRAFRVVDAQRLAARLPQARLVTVPDSRTFVAEDQPERLAQLITEFARAE